MASRTVENINLPQVNRQSLPITDLPQVSIPKLNGGAARLLAMGAITRDMAATVLAIDQKNQETAANKEFTGIFLEAQKEINDFHATATGDEDISGQTLAIYDKFINGIDSRGLPSAQAAIIKEKLQQRQLAVGQMGLDYELKLKAQKYDADLNQAIENSANIVAGDPRLFDDQLKNVEEMIGASRLNGAEKAERINKSRETLGRVYLSRLSELNPGKARAEANSKRMNEIIDPGFKTSLLSKLDSEAKAKASIALQEDVKKIDQARKLGVAVPAEFISQTAAQARAAGNERQAAALEKYAGLQDYNINFSQKSLADQQFEIRELQTKARLGDLSDLDRLEVAAESFNDKLKSIKTNPWNYYAEKGVIENSDDSLLGSTPQAAGETLARRRLAQEKVNQLEGGAVQLPLLKPNEINQLAEMKQGAEPKQLAATLVSIGSNMSGKERRATVAAVAAKEPLLAVAMGQDFDTATRLIAGSRAKAEVTPAKVREKTAEKLKGITLDGTVNDALNDAVYAYYTQIALEKGDTSKEAQSELVDKAVADVVGNVVDINIGAPSRVIAPVGLSASDIEDRLGAITDEMLVQQQGQLPQTSDGFAAKAEDIIRFGQFLSAGDGMYAVRFPTGALYRDDGRPYTIDINQITDTTASVAKNRRRLDRSSQGVISYGD